jgi:hypothetical protein
LIVCIKVLSQKNSKVNYTLMICIWNNLYINYIYISNNLKIKYRTAVITFRQLLLEKTFVVQSDSTVDPVYSEQKSCKSATKVQQKVFTCAGYSL